MYETSVHLGTLVCSRSLREEELDAEILNFFFGMSESQGRFI
jgi:hypothetical protein